LIKEQQWPSLIQLYSFSPGQIPKALILLIIAKMKTQLHANLKSINNKNEQNPLINAPRLWANRIPFLSSIIDRFLILNRYSNREKICINGAYLIVKIAENNNKKNER
jgi:hypothetical protein